MIAGWATDVATSTAALGREHRHRGVTPSEIAAASSNGPPLGPRESPIPT